MPTIPNSFAYTVLAIIYGTIIVGTLVGIGLMMGMWSRQHVKRAKKLHRRRHLKLVK
jgi:hypothetical protein